MLSKRLLMLFAPAVAALGISVGIALDLWSGSRDGQVDLSRSSMDQDAAPDPAQPLDQQPDTASGAKPSDAAVNAEAESAAAQLSSPAIEAKDYPDRIQIHNNKLFFDLSGLEGAEHAAVAEKMKALRAEKAWVGLPLTLCWYEADPPRSFVSMVNALRPTTLEAGWNSWDTPQLMEKLAELNTVEHLILSARGRAREGPRELYEVVLPDQHPTLKSLTIQNFNALQFAGYEVRIDVGGVEELELHDMDFAKPALESALETKRLRRLRIFGPVRKPEDAREIIELISHFDLTELELDIGQIDLGQSEHTEDLLPLASLINLRELVIRDLAYGTADQVKRGFAFLSPLTELRKLVIKCALHRPQAAPISIYAMRHLNHLEMLGLVLEVPNPRQLPPCLQQLTTLACSVDGERNDAILSQMTSLERAIIGGGIHEHLANALVSLPRIQELDLRNAGFSDLGAQAFSRLHGVKKLCINGNGWYEHLSDRIDTLLKIPGLEELEIYHAQLRSEQVAEIASAPTLKRLLISSSTSIETKPEHEFPLEAIGERFSSLESFEAENVAITAKAFERIAAIPSLKQIRFKNMRFKGIIDFSALREHPSLESIAVLGRRGFEAKSIKSLATCPLLQFVHLPLKDEAEAERLRAALPNATIRIY